MTSSIRTLRFDNPKRISPLEPPLSTSVAERIIAAAIDCFSVRGSGITMLEVATKTGVTHRTLYRTFPGRRALIEAVAVSRLDRIIEQVRPRLEAQEHLADALVTGFVEFTRQARADRVFIAALDEASDWQLERFLVGTNEKFFTRADTLWRASIDRAMQAHEWRRDLDSAQVNAWLRAVAVILLLRDDLDVTGQEQLVRNFVVPALVSIR
jgi:AcrR family transcriptional regulator